MSTNKNNIQLLSRLWLQAVRDAALEDIHTAQIQFGLPLPFLEGLINLPIDRLLEISDSLTTLPFQPRLPQSLLMRLLNAPAEANLATVIQGVRQHARAID